MRKILVVEDEERLCSAIVAYLKSQGVDPIATATIQEAISVLGGDEIDMMVLDLNLGGGGLDVLRHVRGSPELAELPVLAMSAWDMEPACYDYLEPGDYVTKPFDMRLLELMIRRFLELPQGLCLRAPRVALPGVDAPEDGSVSSG
jgi:DNA-binding response OmpR family regulator